MKALLNKANSIRKNQQVGFRYGLGCKYFDNCLKCPYKPDCIATETEIAGHRHIMYLYRVDGIYSKEPI